VTPVEVRYRAGTASDGQRRDTLKSTGLGSTLITTPARFSPGSSENGRYV
jgi:hypothetical protein